MNATIQPDYLVTPGEILAEHLETRGFTQKEFSQRCGYSEKHLSQLMTGKVTLTVEAAMKLELVLGVPAKYWLDLETQYKLDKLRLEGASTSANDVEWAKTFPIKQMTNFGWLPPLGNWDEKVQALFRFFGVTSSEGWASQFGNVVQAQCRRSTKKTPDLPALSAWVQHLENVARAVPVQEFSPEHLDASIPRIKSILASAKPNFWNELVQLLEECGIVLRFAPHLPNTYVSGITTWVAGRPAIQLSTRYPFLDVLTFSLFHELAHVSLHRGKAPRFVDLEDYGQDPLELEANAWARDRLIPPDIWRTYAVKPDSVTAPKVLALAKACGVHPGTVVGRLAHEGIIDWRSPLRKYRVKVQGE